jgi:hypothetical protein
MRWLTTLYSMTAAVYLTLAAVHLLVWSKRPAPPAHLAFALTAIFVASITPFELAIAERKHPSNISRMEYVRKIRGLIA